MARTDGRQRPCRLAVVLLVLLSCVFVLVALVGSWADRNLLDTPRFTERVGPAIEEPAVQEAVTNKVTTSIMDVVDPARLFTEAFDDRPAAQLLAVPLAGAVESFVHDKVGEVVASDGFAELWQAAVERAHTAAVRVLRDESAIVGTEGDEVVLDLRPVVQAVLARIGEEAPELLADSGGLESLSVDDLPEVVVERIEEATGVTLDEDFGTVVVYEGDALGLAQQGVLWFERGVWIALALAVLSAAAALWLSRSRRRTGFQLIVGVGIVIVVLRRALLKVEDEIPSLAPTAEGGAAALVVVDRFVQPLLTFTGWTLAVLALVAVVLAATGPYGWARRFRSAFDDGGRVPQHRDLVSPGIIGLAFVVLWFGDLDWWAMAVVLVAAVAGWMALNRDGPEDAPAAPAT